MGRPPKALVAASLVLLLGVYVVPRLVAYHGLTLTNPIRFGDMQCHVANVNILHMRGTLTPKQLEDPLFARFPAAIETVNAIKWPPGTYMIARLWAGFFGPASIWTTQLTNLFFTLILIAAVVGLGSLLASVRVGLWAALLVLLVPPLAADTWYLSLDYPLTAMLMGGLYLLLRTEGFTRPGWCAALGVWSALGLYVKMTYAVHLALPALVVLVRGVRRVSARRAGALAAGAAVVAVGGLILLLPQFAVGSIVKQAVAHFGGDLGEKYPFQLLQPGSLRWLLSMPRMTLQAYSWPLLLLALPGVVLAHRRARRSFPGLLLVVYIWWTWLWLTLMTHKMERYLHSTYVVLGLLTAWWISEIVPRRWRTTGLAWAAAAHGAVLYLVFLQPQGFFLPFSFQARERFMYEVLMPSKQELALLRRNVYSLQGQYGPLVRAAREMLRGEKTRRPAGIVVNWPGDPMVSVSPAALSTALYLGCLDDIQDRLLVNVDEGTFPRTAVPVLVVVDRPGRRPRQFAGHRVVGTRVLSMMVSAEPAPRPVLLQLWLLRQDPRVM